MRQDRKPSARHNTTDLAVGLDLSMHVAATDTLSLNAITPAQTRFQETDDELFLHKLPFMISCTIFGCFRRGDRLWRHDALSDVAKQSIQLSSDPKGQRLSLFCTPDETGSRFV